MAITLTQAVASNTSGSATTHNLSYGSNRTAGTLLVLLYSFADDFAPTSISDANGTWTDLNCFLAGSNFSCGIAYWANNSQTDTGTVDVVLGTARALTYALYEVSGVATSAPLNTSRINTATIAAADPQVVGDTAITTTETDTIIFGNAYCNDAVNMAASYNSWTNSFYDLTTIRNVALHQIVNATGSYNPEFNPSVANLVRTGVIAAFKADVSGLSVRASEVSTFASF